MAPLRGVQILGEELAAAFPNLRCSWQHPKHRRDMTDANDRRGVFKKLVGEVRGNALWDMIKTAGWWMLAAVMALIRWLQDASRSAVVLTLLGFWVASVLVCCLLEFRRRKKEPSPLLLPGGFQRPVGNWVPTALAEAGVLAVVFAAAGIVFSIWFKEPTVLPIVSLQQVDGLPATVPQDPHLRLNRLIVQNEQNVDMEHLVCRVQLPEPIFTPVSTNHPPGTIVEWRPVIEPITLSGTGDRSMVGPSSAVYYNSMPPETSFSAGAQGEIFKLSRDGDLTGVWELRIDRLPRHAVVSILFLTSNGPSATNYLHLVSTEFVTNGAQITATAQQTTNGTVLIHDLSFTATLNNNTNYHFGTNALKFSVEGRFQYQEKEKAVDQWFLVPLTFDVKQRRISSLPIQTSDDHWRRIIVEFQ
jgi:hypothetical protein